MVPKVNLYKMHVNKVLMNLPIQYANYYELCDKNEKNFEDVYRYLLHLLDEFAGKSDNYINKLLTGILSYIDCFNREELIMNNQDCEKILAFEQIYLKYKNDNGKTPDKKVIETIKQLEDAIALNRSKEIDMEESNDELKVLIDEKDRIIADLTKAITELEKKVDSLQKAEEVKTKLITKIKELREKIKNLEVDNRSLKKATEEEKNAGQQLVKEKDALIEELQNISDARDLLLQDIEELKKEINNLNETLRVIKKEKTDTLKKELRDDQLDKYLRELLLTNNLTLRQIMNNIEQKCLKFHEDEVIASLARIRQSINIVNPYDKQNPVIYGACPPFISTTGTYTLPFKREMDLIVTGDWHIRRYEDIKHLLSYLDLIYKYCLDKKINNIINLGDFLDIPNDDPITEYYFNMHLLDSILKEFPQEKSISHAILGGNHDRRMLKIGVDALGYLEQNRSDFISLGYDFSKLIIPGNESDNMIGLHHPRISNIDVNQVIETSTCIASYLDDFYSDNKLVRDTVYLDLLGHFHISRFDANNSMCFVPSLVCENGDNANGLIHLKIVFDKNRNIEYIIVKSLGIDSKIVPICDNIYQKKR